MEAIRIASRTAGLTVVLLTWAVVVAGCALLLRQWMGWDLVAVVGLLPAAAAFAAVASAFDIEPQRDAD